MATMVESVIPIASVLLSGGLVLGLMRISPERSNLAVTASERAVDSLLKTMDDLEDRLKEAADREADLQVALAEHRKEINLLRVDLAKRRSEIVELRMERDAWKQRAIDLGWSE